MSKIDPPRQLKNRPHFVSVPYENGHRFWIVFPNAEDAAEYVDFKRKRATIMAAFGLEVLEEVENF